MENSMGVQLLKTLKIELLYDPVFPLLGIYLRKTKTLIQKDICTPMFIAALFTIAKIRKQSKCTLIDEWIRYEMIWYDMIESIYIYIYTHINGLPLNHKKEWNNAICSNVDGLTDYHTKWSNSEKGKYHMTSLICGIQKNDTNELTYKTEIDSQT